MIKNFVTTSFDITFLGERHSVILFVKYSGDGPEPDLLSDTPPVPPRRRERKRHTPPRPVSNGLPPTPKVHMGACFSKVNNNYNIHIKFK